MVSSWALVPVAGRGTRMLPASAVIPKVLLPVGTRPMLHWALDEAVDAGIPGIVLVVGPEQELVRRYVRAAGDAFREDPESCLGRLGCGLAGVELVWIEQPEPRGVGDALARCRPVTGGDDFAVLLPDNWFRAAEPAIVQVARSRAATGMCTLGLTRVEPAEAPLFGNVGGVELEPLGGDAYRILALQDKGPGTFRCGGAPALRGCARYALGPEFYDALLAAGPPAAGEWDDVPAFQALIEGPGLAGHHIHGRHYDVGMPAGYLAAASYLRDAPGESGC